MSLYDIFETDADLEANGIWVDYGDFRIRIAATSQGNKAYVRYLEKKLKPVRRAMDTGSLTNERSQAIMADVFARTVVVAWETKQGDEWVSGIESRDGDLLPFNPENVEKTLISLPRLLLDLQEQATSLSNYRRAQLTEEAGN